MLTAASAGRLAEQTDIDTHVARLLALRESQQVIGDFHRQWLALGELSSVDRSTELFPMLGPELVAAAEQEAEPFASYVLRQGDGRLTSSHGAPLAIAKPTRVPSLASAKRKGERPCQH